MGLVVPSFKVTITGLPWVLLSNLSVTGNFSLSFRWAEALKARFFLCDSEISPRYMKVRIFPRISGVRSSRIAASPSYR